MTQANTVQSVERAMKILEALAAEADGLGVTELSRRVKLHKSTVHRLLSTLLGLGYVEKNEENERYRLGMKLLYLGSSILERMDLRHEAYVFLKELSREVNEAVHLVVPDGYSALYVDKLEGNKTIRMHSQIGKRVPMHASAVGKAIMAFEDERFVKEILERDLPKFTKKTITDPKQLQAHLQDIRSRGFAVDDEENEEGIRCVGAPIFDYTGKVIGAVSVSGPTVTVLPERVQDIAEKLRACADKISNRMGWNTAVSGRKK